LHRGLADHIMGLEEGRHVAMQAAEIARVFAARLQFPLDLWRSEAEASRVQGGAALPRLVFGAGGFLGIAPVGGQPRRA